MVNFQRYAVQDWSGEQGDSKFSSPLNFQRGDIIAAFEIDGILRFSFQFRNFGVSFLHTISNLIITPVCNHCGVLQILFQVSCTDICVVPTLSMDPSNKLSVMGSFPKMQLKRCDKIHFNFLHQI
jgi:hypothetical protein